MFPFFPHLFAMKWWDQMPWSLLFECWVLSQLFHSSFTFIKRLFSSSLSAIECCHLCIWGYWYFSWQPWFQLVLCPASISHDVLCIWVKWQYTALMYFFPNFEPAHWSMFGSICCFFTYIQTSQEAGNVVWYPHLFKYFPQFVVIHCQWLWCSQQSRGRCFSGILLHFLRFRGCWQSVLIYFAVSVLGLKTLFWIFLLRSKLFSIVFM